MKKRQVIILWVVAVALGGSVAAVKLSQTEATKVSTDRKAGDLFLQSFPTTDAVLIEIRGAEGSVDLAKKDGKWVVVQRGNYPANNTFVNDLVRTLGDVKVKLALEAGPSFAPRFGMDESATKAEDRGLTAIFKDASGKELAKIGLGKNIEGGAASSPMAGMGGAGAVGRYVRNFADESGFYAVSEMFSSVSADPMRWLSDGFINPEKIKTVSVSKPGKTDQEWKVTRDTEDAEFKFDNAAAGEVLDATIGTSLKGLFSYARFEDVVPADQVAAKEGDNEKRQATIETVEGFTYKLTLVSTEVPETGNAPSIEPLKDNFLVTVEVDANIPAERKKEENEKPEDAKAKDDAFASRQKELTEKLAKEKAFAGITFEVGKALVDPLLKTRHDLIAKPAAPEDAAANGNVQQMPGGLIATPPVRPTPPTAPTRPPATATTPPIEVTSPPIEATTPPVSVPEAEEEKGE